MGLGAIPIIGVGPGSQPSEEDGATLDYIAMPHGMSVYERPAIPEPEEVDHLDGAMEVLGWIHRALQRYRVGDQPLVANLGALDAENRELVNQVLGEGEVSAQYVGDFRARVQESVLAGVWRTFYLDSEGRPTHDLVEIADVPVIARLTPKTTAGKLPSLSDLDVPTEVTNALPILTELQDRCDKRRPGDPPHVINLTLLPLSPADSAFLDQTLGAGPVRLLSRGYGDCRINSSAYPNIWSVRYYNSTGTLILDTLEVVDIPVVACAADEDITDSAGRLQEILDLYTPSSTSTAAAEDHAG